MRPTAAVPLHRESWHVADSLALAGLCAVSLALSIATIVRRGDLVRGAEFLFHDAGHNLLVADTLLSGHSLYRDVFYPYGPLPPYAYAAVAFLFDNTPTVYLALLAAISAVNSVLAYILIRRAAGFPTAVLVSVALMALLPIPGALAGAFTVSPHLVLERTLLLVIALCWTPVERSWKSSVAMGTALGVWQGVKFGGALVAGSVILLLDALYLFAVGMSKAKLGAWVRSLLLIGASFVAIELVWVSLAFRTGPPALALDTLFPLYIFQTYSTVVTADIRWPLWGGWRLAVGQYLLPSSAGALGLVGLVGWLRRLRRGADLEQAQLRTAGGTFLLLLFFLISTVTYFRHVYHFQQFLWALLPAAAWPLHRVGAMRMGILLAWAPGILIVLRSAWLTLPPASMVHLALPTGGTLLVDAAMERRLSFLRRLTSEEPAGKDVLYVPMGSGWHFAYGIAPKTRHTWFFASDVVRPYDQGAFLRSLDETRALVTCNVPGASELPLSGMLPLPVDIAREVYSRLELTMTDAGCHVYRVGKRQAPFP